MSDEADLVYRWRLDRVLEVVDRDGKKLTLETAEQLALLTAVDVHRFAALVRAGCPVKTAAEIVR